VHTQQGFRRELLPGGHFFLRTASAQLREFVSEALAAVVLTSKLV
jgi:surfactin synthase thioesterase subunit